MFEIKTNLTLPPHRRTTSRKKQARSGRGPRPKYPFANMEVGDAFDVQARGKSGRRNYDKSELALMQAAYHWARGYNPAARFIVRLINEATVRVWRVA